jgi:2-aminoadipate transaminase
MVGPPAVIDAATRLKQAADLHTPSLTQLIVATLLRDEPRQAAHLDDVRALYRARSAALHASLREHLGDHLDVRPTTGGMFVWATATDGTDTDALFDRAVAHGVAFVPGSAFSLEPGHFRDAMRLSFATLEPEQLDVAVARLAAAWRSPVPPGRCDAFKAD